LPHSKVEQTVAADGRPLRVCHVITEFNTGGAERVLLQTVRRLNAARFSSLIVSLRARGPLSEQAATSGAEVVHLGAGRRPGPLVVWSLAKLFRERGVDIVHAYLYDASLAARIAGRIAHVPVLLTSTRASLGYLPRIAWWLDRITARWSQRIIAVSNGTADFIVRREGIPSEKVVVIPNGVDVSLFHPGDRRAARANLEIPQDAFVVACVGRLSEQKGHRYLLDALDAVHAEIPSILCLIAGEGPLLGELETRAHQFGLAGVCRFLGLVNPIQSVYEAADVLVLPSLYEGMPNVVLEAMASGCPVIATAVEGSTELVVPNVTGVLIPAGSGRALAAALFELARNPERRTEMGRQSRLMAEREHGIERMVAAIERLYMQEFAQRKRRKVGGVDA